MIFDNSAQSLALFTSIWGALFANFRQEVSQHQMQTAFLAWQGRTSEELQKAVTSYVTTESYLDQNPLPKLLQFGAKERDERLKTMAIRVWGEILHNLSGADVVIASKRGAYALKSVFGSLTALAKSPDNEFQNSKDQQAFISAFCDVDEGALDERSLQFVFWGTAHNINGNSPNVRFIGNYEKCLELAQAVYPPLGMSPKYPLSALEQARHQALINKRDTEEREKFLRDMTDEEWDNCIAQIKALSPKLAQNLPRKHTTSKEGEQ